MTKTFTQLYEEFVIPMEGRQCAMDNVAFWGDIYLFGIWSGVSTKLISDYLNEEQIPYDNIWGFDSFIGLPEEDARLRHREHTIGKYSAVELYRKSMAETMKIIEEGVGNPKLTLIPGWYSKVLNEDFQYEYRVASFVDIDVDLHSSAVDVLEFLFSNELVATGTTIYFDDWGATEEYEGGESLAWKLMTEKYNIRYEMIHTSGEGPCVVKVFKIL